MAQKEQPKFGMLPKIINGSIAGLVGVTCVFPLDLVKTRLQNQQIGPNGERMYRSIVHCGVTTFRNEGFFGMYRGAGVNLLLITPEKAIKLVGNDFFRHHLTTKEGLLPLHREVLAGAAAGCCQVVVTTPMELLKIQMQDSGRTAGSGSKAAASPGAAAVPAAGKAPSSSTVSSSTQQTQRRSLQTSSTSKSAAASRPSATQLALDLLREKGVRGLFKGYSPTLLRDVTFSAIYFPLFANFNKLGKRRKEGGEAVFYVTLLAGLAAGSLSCFIVTPLDVVKTRLQTIRKAQGEANFNGIVDCFVKTYRNEGVKAFFKGGACRVMVIAPLFGIAQVVYFLGIGEYLLGVQKQAH